MLGLMLSLLLLQGTAHAQGIVVSGAGAAYTFAQQMTFTVTARVVDIRSAEVVFHARNRRSGAASACCAARSSGAFVQQLVGVCCRSAVTFWELTDAPVADDHAA
jgi:hypothetical protein